MYPVSLIGAAVPEGSLQQLEAPTTSALAATTSAGDAVVGNGVITKGRGKSPAKGRDAAAVSSSLGAAVDPGVLSALGVALSPEGVQTVANLFFKVSEYARRFYHNMVVRQLPSSGLNDELLSTGIAIWYGTYREMCKDVFVSMCICEYHSKHRSDFIHAIPGGVLSDSSDHGAVPLTGNSLLAFLSRLDCAVLSKVESIFGSYWDETSVSLEGEALNGVVCEDFTRVLDTTGIPEVALSILVIGSSVEKEIGRGTIKRTASGVITAPDLILSTQYHPEDGSFSDPVAGGGHVGSGDVPVSDCAKAVIVRAPVWTPPVLGGGDVLPSVGGSGAGSFPPITEEGHVGSDNSPVPASGEMNLDDGGTRSSSVVLVPSYLQCVNSLGLSVSLHPDSTKLVGMFLFRVRGSLVMSFSRSVGNYISKVLLSDISMVQRSICFKTYRELHLCIFMSKCLCIYHSKYRPAFMRSLASIRVLPDSPDRGLVPLSGSNLVDFLSRLDSVVRGLVECVFNSRWDVETNVSHSERECGSLSDVSCEDIIRALNAANVSSSSFSIFRRYMIYKGKRLVSGSKITGKGTVSGSDTTSHEPLPKSHPRPKKQLRFSPLLGGDSDSIFDESSSTGKDVSVSAKVAPLSLPSVSSAPISSSPYTSESDSQSRVGLESLLLLKDVVHDRFSSYRFVKLLSCVDQSCSVSATDTVSTFVVPPEGTESSLPPSESVVAADVSFASVTAVATFSDVSDSESADSSREAEEGYIQGSIAGGNLQQVLVPRDTTSDAAISAVVTAVGNGVSTKGRGKASAKKGAASVAVSYLDTTLNPNILSSLGVVLSPESVRVIAGLFYEVGEFARRVYEGMIRKQLPSIMSGKFSMTGLAIWYHTYSSMCKYFFVSRCLGEYHANHRPGFIRTLPSIQVVSDFSGHDAVTLTGDALLGFLSRLDCAIRSEVESIFDSCLSEVSVPLREESLSAINCRDLVDVMSVAGISQVALSVMLLGFRVKKAKKRRIHKDDVPVPVPVLVPGGTRIVRAPFWVPPLANPSELSLLSSDENSRGGPSSDPIAVEGHADDAVSVPHPSELSPLSSAENSRGGPSSDPIAAEGHVDDGVAVAVPHPSELSPLSSTENCGGVPSPDLISAEGDTPSSSAFSIPSYLECASSLGVELHPDSVPLIHSFFRRVHLYIVTSFLRSVRSYISTAIGSGLSVVGRFVWFETYRELNLYNFISRCLGSYHYNYRPDFVRDLSNIRVLSDSSDLGLQLSGGGLVDFLSRLDYVVHNLINCVFNSQWDVEVDRACSGLEDGSLDNVSCEDLIYVLNTAGVPELALSVYQRRRKGVKRRREGIKRSRKGIPGSSSKITSKGKASSGGATGVGLQPQPELLLQPQPELLPQPQPELLPSSDLRSGVSSGSLSPLIPESSFECDQLPIFAPFLQHHWLEKLD
ncbi:hypothetical protein [Candidatus Ichthyocystis sparus]|uniref:hypothetical protein n=1 Tax=Candidatus Ichthyocystis sparus TaxID=1561004 RepID=UPI0011473B61|nr:hypothetical protein [Candidatus Ichthyocystis sparus]